MSDYKISVIIPVYNAQDTIERSINSVINQTIGFSNIELILYDDNSNDDSRKILKKYAKKYKNIILVLSDENSGHAGKGRNEGMKRASADYIMFMDNDDKYSPDMCETLYNEIIKEDADIVSCNYLNIDNISSEIIFNELRGGQVDAINDKIIFLDKEVYDFKDNLIWSKIFRKSIIIENNLKFPEDKTVEDAYFIYVLLFYVNKIVYLKDFVGYIRHVQEDSLSKNANYNETIGMIDICFDIYSFYKNKNYEIDFSWFFTTFLGASFGNIINSNINDPKEINDLLNYIYTLEKETNFDDSYFDIINRISNKLLMKKQFKLLTIYFNILRNFFNSKFLRRIYRLINN